MCIWSAILFEKKLKFQSGHMILTMKDEHNWSKRPTYKQGKIIKDYTDWDFRMRPLAIVTGWLH